MPIKRTEKSILFIGWDGFDQRNQAYSEVLHAHCEYVNKHHINRVAALLAWFKKSWLTYRLIIKYRPQIVIIKNTHFIIASVLLLYKQIFQYKLVLDSHSCGFDNRFAYPTFMHKVFVKRADLSLVTNKGHGQIVSHWGGIAHIVHFPPINFSNIEISDYKTNKGFNICYVHTYSNDEPYWAVVEAVKQLDNVTLYITGNDKKSTHPLENSDKVVHTGFISRGEYLGLLNNCDSVMVLTTRDNTMQKGGNEAVFLEKPIIISDFRFLRSYFSKGCVYVKANSESIKQGVLDMINQYNQYQKGIKELKKSLEEKNTRSIMRILDILNTQKDKGVV